MDNPANANINNPDLTNPDNFEDGDIDGSTGVQQ